MTATQTLALAVIVITFALLAITTGTLRRRPNALRLRPLPAMAVLPPMVGGAVEADRPLLLSLGNATVGAESTVLAIAAARLLEGVAYDAAIGATPPRIVVSVGSSLPLAQDTLRRAYAARGLVWPQRLISARWVPDGADGLALAALLSALAGAERAAGLVLVGPFGAELALPLLTAAREDVPTLAGSTALSGMAVAYGMADGALIGPDALAGGAYTALQPAPAGTRAELIVQDVLRVALVLLVLTLAAAAAFPDTVGPWVARVLGGWAFGG